MNRISLVLVFLISTLSSIGQVDRVYRVNNGKVGVGLQYQDTTYLIGSNELKFVMDYETGDVFIRIDPSTFKSGTDSVDALVYREVETEIVFKGNTGLRNLSIKDQAPIEVNINGVLSINDVERDVTLYGEIFPFMEGVSPEGIFYLYCDARLAELHLPYYFDGFPEFGCVEMIIKLNTPEAYTNN